MLESRSGSRQSAYQGGGRKRTGVIGQISRDLFGWGRNRATPGQVLPDVAVVGPTGAWRSRGIDECEDCGIGAAFEAEKFADCCTRVELSKTAWIKCYRG